MNFHLYLGHKSLLWINIYFPLWILKYATHAEGSHANKKKSFSGHVRLKEGGGGGGGKYFLAQEVSLKSIFCISLKKIIGV